MTGGNKEDEDNKDEQYHYKEDLTSDMEQKLLVIQGAHPDTQETRDLTGTVAARRNRRRNSGVGGQSTIFGHSKL